MDEILSKYARTASGSLIPILQEVQKEEGYLTKKSILKVGNYLNIPVSKIYSITTFYNQFRFQPRGKFHIKICRGTACHIEGSTSILKELEKVLGIKENKTTRDGIFSLEIVSCMGACSLAPVMAINGEYFSHLNSSKIQGIIEEFRNYK